MQNCLKTANSSYKIVEAARLGRGASGEVFVLCNANDCNTWVAKVVRLNTGGRFSQTDQDFAREARMSVELGVSGLGPRVLDWIVCPDIRIGILLIERLDITLHDYIRQSRDRYTPELLASVESAIRSFAQQGFYNPDLHTENIMLRLRTGEIKFIDAAYTRRIHAGESKATLTEKMIRTLHKSLNNVTLAQRPKRQTPPRVLDLTATQLETPSPRKITPTQLDTPSQKRTPKKRIVLDFD